MKKIISMLLVLMLICTFCTPAFAVTDQSRDSGICGALATYALYFDGELWIAPYAGRSGAEINDRAFCGRSEIVDVVIENGIAKIGEEAFSDCKSLRTIELPDSVTSIGQYAFSACRLLETVAIPDSVTSIEMFTFSGCSSLRSIVLPNSVASIDMYAFRSCQQLESVTICNGEATIWDRAFADCSNNLTIISHKGGEVERYATENGIAFKDIDDANDTNFAATDQVVERNNCGIRASYVLLPNGELRISGSGKIDSFAFAGRNDIKDVIIENGITIIGEGVFCGCFSLMSVSIPDSVTNIGHRAFYLCKQLESVTICNGEATIWDSAFEYCSNNLTIISQSRGYNKVEGYAARNGIAFEEIDDTNGTASILSDGILWIIIAVAVVAVGGVVALIIVKKKTAIAGGAENTDEE